MKNDDSDKIALLEAILKVKGDPKRSARRFLISSRNLSPKLGDWFIVVYDTMKRRYTAEVVLGSSPSVDAWLVEMKMI